MPSLNTVYTVPGIQKNHHVLSTFLIYSCNVAILDTYVRTYVETYIDTYILLFAYYFACMYVRMYVCTLKGYIYMYMTSFSFSFSFFPFFALSHTLYLSLLIFSVRSKAKQQTGFMASMMS